MIIVKKTNGDDSAYNTADEVQAKGQEYILLANGKPVAQFPRERVEEIAFVPNKAETPTD